jgi:hypothetical protein
MGIRAYRVKRIKYAQEPLFKIGEHPNVDFWIDLNCSFGSLNAAFEIDRDLLEELLSDIEQAKKEHGFDDGDIDVLKAMLEECGDEDCVTYHCF